MEFLIDIPSGCIVAANEVLLNTALLNLIKNSVQHSKGTQIALKWLREENGNMVFTFSDNGIGVTDEHLMRLFDLFYRVDDGRARKNGGAGLGLPLVSRIFIALDGTITVANKPGGGLEFIFTLPKGN